MVDVKRQFTELLSYHDAYKKMKEIVNSWRENAIRDIKLRRILGLESVISISEGVGGFVAEDVKAPFDFPVFNVSGVDGWAVSGEEEGKYRVVGEIMAGDVGKEIKLKAGEACWVATGAKVPAGTVRVVMKEHAEESDGYVWVPAGKRGDNFDRCGDDIRNGELLLRSFDVVRTKDLPILANYGILELRIFRLPVVAFVTGDELLDPRQADEKILKMGMVVDVHSTTLKSLIERMGYSAVIERVKDVKDEFKERVYAKLCEGYRLFVSTGAASVGKKDLVVEVISELGFEKVFHGVRQKPGKPTGLYYNERENAVFLVIPGKPFSATMVMHTFLVPMLKMIRGEVFRFEKARLSESVEVKGKRAEWIPVIIEDDEYEDIVVRPLALKSSLFLSNLFSDGVIYVESGERLSAGEKVIFVKWL